MSNDQKRPLKVFLCHAHSDKNTVFSLYERLSKDGVDVWLDKKSLIPGQDWEFEIRKAVSESDVVIVCLSEQFNQKGFRQREVSIALDEASLHPEGEIFIIPARLEECESLESLRKWHWVDLFESDGYENLMRALRTRANKIGATLQNHTGWFSKKVELPLKTKSDSANIVAKSKSISQAPSHLESKKKQSELSTRTLSSIYMVLFAVAVISAWLSIFTIVASGPILTLAGFYVAFVNQRKKIRIGIAFGLSSFFVSAICFALINFLNWSPDEAQVPIATIATISAVIVSILGIRTISMANQLNVI